MSAETEKTAIATANQHLALLGDGHKVKYTKCTL